VIGGRAWQQRELAALPLRGLRDLGRLGQCFAIVSNAFRVRRVGESAIACSLAIGAGGIPERGVMEVMRR
jgi:hypothetical protein